MKWTALATACWTAAMLLAEPGRGSTLLPFEETAAWANKLGTELYKICSKATGLHELRKDYTEKYQASVRKKDGSKLVERFATDIQDLFKKRLEAVQRIKYKAEELHKKHEFVTDHHELNKVIYADAKGIDMKQKPKKSSADQSAADDDADVKDLAVDRIMEADFIVKPSPDFYNLRVNLTNSTVHVPTNIYTRAPEVIGNISWSGKLDEYFRRNWAENWTRSWQYFASSMGFLRYFPGSQWRFPYGTDGHASTADYVIDLYDARMSAWYAQAASQPKNALLLLDSSGSLKGRRMQIAKATLMRILDTLTENDFFNVIVFANETSFLDHCSNNTLLQATYHNKKRIEAALENVKTEKVADFVQAFTVAFELLIEVNGTQQCAQCNNAIMVITDGSPESHEEVFRKFNWAFDKWVRVFTYLIGQEIPENDAMKVSWMACANRGHFYHIYTMADVQEHVQDYLRVMSRPLAIKAVNHTVFTGININFPFSKMDSSYGSTLSLSDSWIKLPDGHKPEASVTIAVPVYDKSETRISVKAGPIDNGKLLGVSAADVSLEEIMALVPQYKLGANGYFFIITNNGFIVTHPYFRPLVESCALHMDQACYLLQINPKFYKSGSTKPGYNNIDLLLVENDDSSGDLIDSLRRAMIDQEVGNITVNATGYFDISLSRVRIQTQTYYYHPIRGTTYSIGISLPKKVDAYEVYGELRSVPDPLDFNFTQLEIANWTYCSFTPEELAEKSVLKLVLELVKSKDAIKEKCDEALVKLLHFDAHATRGMLAVWMGNNNHPSDRSTCLPAEQDCKEQPSQPRSNMAVMSSKKGDGGGGGGGRADATTSPRPLRNGNSEYAASGGGGGGGSGVELVFVGTQSGLTRYHQLVDKPSSEDSSADFIRSRTDTLRELYYARASYAGNDTWVFSVPFDSHLRNESNVAVLASTGVFVKSGGRVGMAAALGLQMRYGKIKDLMMSLSFPCRGSNQKSCRQGCADENITCYLIDNNAYVVVSEHIGYVGRHFREVDYQVMEELELSSIFKTYTIMDHQAICTVCDPSKSLASKLLSPFVHAYKLLYWMIAEFALFLVEFNLSAWLSEWNYAKAEPSAAAAAACGSKCNSSLVSAPQTTRDVPCTQVQRHNELLGTFSALESSFDITACYSCRIIKLEEDDDYAEIDNGTEVLDDENFAVRDGKKRVCSFVQAPCSRSLAVHRVPKTNLFLLVLPSGCQCEKTSNSQGSCYSPNEVTDAQGCSAAMANSRRYRRLPGTCFNKLYKEEDAKCSGAARTGVTALPPPALVPLASLVASAAVAVTGSRGTPRWW